MEPVAGAGSVWNANSWHWEEKNYTRWSTEYLQQRLAAGTVLAATEGLTIQTVGDTEVKGEACVSIRKRKLILAVDLHVSFTWEAFRIVAVPSAASADEKKVAGATVSQNGRHDESGAVREEKNADATDREKKCCCTGQIKVEDISADSIEDSDYRFTVSRVSSPTSSEVPAATEEDKQCCLQLLKSQGNKFLQTILTQYLEQLRSKEASADRLAADKRTREEEEQRARVAEATKGEEKQQIAVDEREKDRKFREQEKSKRDADGNAATSQSATPSQMTPLEGRGSVWNPSSYHWEEKPMTSWCQETLKERLSSTDFNILDGSTKLKFFNVTVEGEASNTIRKGRKLVIFDLTIGADWTATARDESGVFLADSRGRLEINDFTSETAEDYQLVIRGDGKIPAQQRIDQAAIREIPLQLQLLLRQFVQDLRARG